MGSGDIAPQLLTSALDGGKWSASSLSRFIPREITHDIYWIGGWVGPRAVLDTVGREKSLAPVGKRTPAIQPVSRRYTD
jgi:hypothetical protein